MIRDETLGDNTQLPLTLGTAGHVDHGKTALVERLTGKNTDRLDEELKRGISIELGFAPLRLPSGRQLSVVDVPGHERFVRTMVAGASGVDLFLFCIAADDGAMPQTREHAAVLRQLGVDRGVVAITKTDLADPASAIAAAAELVPNAPVVSLSVVTGAGLEELVRTIDMVAETVDRLRPASAAPRLHIDRTFTLRGIGTVVTGTLWSGSVGVGDRVAIEPSGLTARVRSVQVHDTPIERAAAGQRVALALVGVDRRAVRPGEVVCDPDAGLTPSYRVDAAISLEPNAQPLPPSARLQVHHGTRTSPARVVPLDGAPPSPGAATYIQLRLERPLVAVAGDRLVLRQLAPPATVGGGVVLDAHPSRHSGSDRVVEPLRAIKRGKDPGDNPSVSPAREPEEGLIRAEPSPGALRLLHELRLDDATPRTDHDLALSLGSDLRVLNRWFGELERSGDAVRVGVGQHFYAPSLAELGRRALELCDRDGEVTIARLRDELGTSRKYAQAIVEHLDRTKLTRRLGDVHVRRPGERT